MANVGDSAHTDHGPGTITAVERQRGSTLFRVAGRGFDVWVPEHKLHVAKNPWGGSYDIRTTVDSGVHDVNEDNSTTLPYDPTPQFSVDQFRREQTILPGEHEIDPDDRLHPSKSLSHDRAEGNRPYPGPSPDLFAKESAQYFYGGEDEDEDEDSEHCQMHEGAQLHYAEEEPFQGDPYKTWGEDEWHDELPDGPERTFGKDASYRPAGLDARYAQLPDAYDLKDPIVAFRMDPVGVIEARNWAMSGEEDRLAAKFGDDTNLAEADPQFRTAAWTDVREKAMRLRKEGRVQINDLAPDRIYATVQGDHGTYDTMIAKSGSMGGIGGGQSITNWHCDCDWGKWAFARRMTYVGRLCSHAYAAYLDMQSQHMKENPGHFKTKKYNPGGKKTAGVVEDFKKWAKDTNDGHWDETSIADFINTRHNGVDRDDVEKLYDFIDNNAQQSPERNYDIPYTLDNTEAYKTADALRLRPQSLTPDMREVPEGEDEHFVDVTKDERDTTGPDDIVHFSSIAARLHRTADGDGFPGEGNVTQEQLDQHPEWQQHMPHDDGGFMGFHMRPDGTTYFGEDRGEPQSPAPATPAAATAPNNQPYIDSLRNEVQGAPKASPEQVQGLQQALQGLRPDAAPAAAPTAPQTGPGSVQHPAQGVSNGGFTGPGGSWDRNTNSSPIGGGAYKVQGGDTLSDIANRAGLHGDYSGITNADGSKITNPNLITPGQALKLPGQGGGAAAPNLKGDAQAAESAVPGNPAGSPAALKGDAAAMTPSAPKPSANPAGAIGALPKAPEIGGPPAPASPPPAPGVPPPPANPAGAIAGVPGASGIGGPKPPPVPGAPKQSRRSFAHLLHYAEDDDIDTRPDTGEATHDLNRLRDLDDEADEHLQHMDDYNDDIRDLVEDLNDAGVDAMPFVARLHQGADDDDYDGEDPTDGNPNFKGRSFPMWADEPFAGSGPDPKLWTTDSASYVDKHERPDFEDVTDLPDGNIIKFNDGRSKPQQGPRAAALHHADGTGYFNPDGPSAQDWEEGSGKPFMDEVSHAADQMSSPGGSGGGADEGGDAEGLGAVAEEAPVVLANRQGGFSLDAFDRGEFAPPGGELRRAGRAGGGPRNAPRIDPGGRGHRAPQQRQASPPPSDFGYDGEKDLTAYGEPAADPTGADIVANFQRSAAAGGIFTNGPAPGSSDDFSSSPMVQGFLRTAGRVFTPAEEKDLEQESHIHGARNLPTEDDLAGTHYLMNL